MVMETLKIYIATWNVAARTPIPSSDFRQLLGLDVSSSAYVNIPDIYVIGLQEVKSQPQNMVWDTLFVDPWTQKINDVLGPLGHVKIITYRMQGLVMSIFVKRSHLIHIRDIESLSTRRGLGGIWGNKGAISIRLGLHGCSLCFVNCHLTPHDNLILDRIDDYKSILEGQVFSYPETSNILFHDYIFWLGDLNFRLRGSKPSESIVEMISDKQLGPLLSDDELSRVRKSGHAFSELSEMCVTFPPTYKFENGVDNYDLKRRPAWTDRILYHVNSNVYDDVNVKLNVEGLSYRSHMKYRESDHRPVTSSFKITVFRPINEKLIDFLDVPVWKLGESNKVFYKICPTLTTTPEDWIGIYKSDFTSLDDYIAYVYTPLLNSDDESEKVDSTPAPVGDSSNIPKEISVIFTENSIALKGHYLLIYFAHPSKSVYGISETFEAVESSF